MGELLRNIIRKEKWKFLTNDEKLDELFEVIDGLQDYLDYHIPSLTKHIIKIEQRMKLLEKAQNRLYEEITNI